MTDSPGEYRSSDPASEPKIHGDDGAGFADRKSGMGQAAERVASEARSGIERGREAAASQAQSLADAASQAAQKLRSQSPSLAQYAERLGAATSGMADRLRNRSFDQLLSDAQDAAREHTAMFLAGSFLAGFAAARFMKASGRRQGISDPAGAGAADEPGRTDPS